MSDRLTITFESAGIDAGSLLALKEALAPLIPRELGEVVAISNSWLSDEGEREETNDLLSYWREEL